MDRLEQQVEMWISDHKEELLADIQKLVRHRSISEKRPKEPVYGQGCKDVLEEMLSLGKRYGFQVENADDVCGVISYEGGERSIGLWGHLDVVPEGGQWVYPPYECTQVGDFLIGRGVQDNKGPCIAALYVLRCLKELQIPFSHTLIQIVGCAEETGMEDVVRYTAQFPVPDYNIITDCGFPVCYGEKGILEARLRSDKAFSSRIVDFYGGSVSNIVPDHASLTLYGCQVLPEAFKDLPEWITIEQKEDLLVLSAKGISAHAAFPDGGINAVSRLCNAVKKTQLLVGEDLKILSFLQELSGNTDGSALGIACQDEESGALTSVCGVVRLDDGHLEI